MAHSEVEALLAEAERTRDQRHSPSRRLRALVDLATAAEPHSHGWLYAQRHLAELLAQDDPWRASLMARRVLAVWCDDDGAWAVFALAQSLLGNFRVAARAYRRALALAPSNPYYAHNLGHLYDVAFDQPSRGLPLLTLAWRRLPDEPEVAGSLAHALVRAGAPGHAWEVLAPVARAHPSSERRALLGWIRWSMRASTPPTAAPRSALGRRVRKRRHTGAA